MRHVLISLAIMLYLVVLTRDYELVCGFVGFTGFVLLIGPCVYVCDKLGVLFGRPRSAEEPDF